MNVNAFAELLKSEEFVDAVADLILKGGEGSGNFGHAGRPGLVGGSAPGEGEEARKPKEGGEAYHGTIVEHAERIIKEGLKPRMFNTVFASAKFSAASAYAVGKSRIDNLKEVAIVVVNKSDFKDVGLLLPGYVMEHKREIPPDGILRAEIYSTDDMRKYREKVAEVGREDEENVPRPKPLRVVHGKGRKSVSDEVYCVVIFKEEEKAIEKGGPGSGNFDHAGRPGLVGGSAPGDGEVERRVDLGFDKWFSGSKIVDPNGNPSVVYHQTSEEAAVSIEREGFRTDFGLARMGDANVPDGVFFKPTTEDIGVGAIGNTVQIPVYLSIKNPLVIETEDSGRALKNLMAEHDAQYDKLWFEQYKDDRKYEAEDNRLRLIMRASMQRRDRELMGVRKANIEEWEKTTKERASKMRERVNLYLKNNGYDGLILTKDIGAFNRVTKTIVALNPNQIRLVSQMKKFKFDVNHLMDLQTLVDVMALFKQRKVKNSFDKESKNITKAPRRVVFNKRRWDTKFSKMAADGEKRFIVVLKKIFDGISKEVIANIKKNPLPVEKGGLGSGHFGHAGRPGKVGGSSTGEGGEEASIVVSDADYIKIVESGDMTQAQNTVNAAAKKAGYNIGPVYHGKKTVSAFYENASMYWFTPSRRYAEHYTHGAKEGKIFTAHLKLQNPINSDTKKGKTVHSFIAAEAVRTGSTFPKVAMKLGYDGDINFKGQEIVVFSLKQIKSAEPVTYDNIGRIIPLSQRFNSDVIDVKKGGKQIITKQGDFDFSDWTFDKKRWQKRLEEEGGDFIKEMYDEMGSAVFDELKYAIGDEFEGSFNIDDKNIQEFIDDYAFKFAEEISTTAVDDITSIMSNAIDEGLSMDDIADRVEERLKVLSENKSKVIARTETIRASNAGAEKAYEQAGIEQKEWLTVGDDRRCLACEMMDGKVIDVGKNFFDKGDKMNVGGRTIVFDYDDVPYPPLHPACRCAIVPVIDTSIFSTEELELIQDSVGLGAIWKIGTSASGHWGHAGRPGLVGGSAPGEGDGDEQIRPPNKFTTGNISTASLFDSSQGHINKVFLAEIEGDGKGIIKNEKVEFDLLGDGWVGKECSQTKREVITSEVDKILRIGLVPQTVLKDLDPVDVSGFGTISGVSSCQYFVERYKPLCNLYSTQIDEIKESGAIRTAVAFDDLIGQRDRHLGNAGISESGELVLIDNGLSFTTARRNHLARDMDLDTDEPSFTKESIRIGKLALENKGKIRAVFSKYGLPLDERRDFFNRAKDMSKTGQVVYERGFGLSAISKIGTSASGHWGHAGRPGLVGGSAPGDSEEEAVAGRAKVNIMGDPKKIGLKESDIKKAFSYIGETADVDISGNRSSFSIWCNWHGKGRYGGELALYGGDDVVHYSLFTLGKNLMNKGGAKETVSDLDKMFKRIGVGESHVYANISIGTYAWARMGFDFTDEDSRKAAVRRLDNYVMEKAAQGNPLLGYEWETKIINELKSKIPDVKTAEDIAKFTIRGLNLTKEQWGIENVDVPYGMKLHAGKAFMLDRYGGLGHWNGVKYL